MDENKYVILLVHGIRTKDLNKSMGKIKSALAKEGVDSIAVNYGWVLLPITNKRAATATAKALEPYAHVDKEVTVVGYSNGAWAAVQAAEMGSHIDNLILISPALHVQHEFPRQIKKVVVYHSETDFAVVLGKYRRLISNILPWRWKIFGGSSHGWGAMGKYGYTGNDPRVTNIDMGPEASHFFNKHPHIISNIVEEILQIIGVKK